MHRQLTLTLTLALALTLTLTLTLTRLAKEAERLERAAMTAEARTLLPEP